MEEGRRTLPLWLIALMKLRTDEAHIAQQTDRPRGAERRGKGHMMSMSMNTHFVSDYERREGTGKNCTFFWHPSFLCGHFDCGVARVGRVP